MTLANDKQMGPHLARLGRVVKDRVTKGSEVTERNLLLGRA